MKASSLSRYWLLIGVTALAIAGLFALVLVAARSPDTSEIKLFSDLFHRALVVHVDLSVLVWFLAFSCMMWSLHAPEKAMLPYLEEAALICFAFATLLITLSSFDSQGAALMSNYIPVLTSPIFFLGLGLLFCGTALMLLRFIDCHGNAQASFVIKTSAAIALVALIDFAWSFQQMPADMIGTTYFETLFWGGGHVLQFVYTQMMLISWLILARTLSPTFLARPNLLFALGCVALFSPVIYVFHDVTSDANRDFFSHLMIVANGIAPLIFAILAVPLLKRVQRNALYSSFAMSIIVFLAGSILGGMIRGQNVVIPAHYHGAIVGVTLAFMGVAYLLLPTFGYRNVNEWKLAFWQPIVYGIGQLMHITGLAWSGGYGVLRKTPGGLENLPVSAKAAMGLMGLGGTLAIIGGLMFVIVAIKAIRRS